MLNRFRVFLIISVLFLLSVITFSSTMESPDWSKNSIYFIMIDRFENGDNQNDVQTDSAIEYGKTNDKFNGGDIQGIIDRLDYIQGMGFNTIWITPPIANQWWDGEVNYGGYHGYWARNFKDIDEHFGDLNLYRKLVDEVHKRGMYIVQDIVANHTGNFFVYKDGKYMKNEKSVPSGPDSYPFNQNDYNDLKQRELNVYHWPSEIDPSNVYDSEFSQLDDLNTENPLVRRALKDAYNFWIEDLGVDGYRIDTAIYVPMDYWNDFFNGEDNIYDKARDVGKSDFFTYGEAWLTPDPYDNSAELKIKDYIDNGFKSMLDFPLYTDMSRVFREGKPTDFLAFRLLERQKQYDPSRMVTFIDNHDMARFYSTSDISSLKQALSLIYTIPGVPTLYYGTEQLFIETRATMFKNGFASGDKDNFNSDSPIYNMIRDLNKLRVENEVFRKGKIDILYSEKNGPGALAYTLTYESERYLVLLNTAQNRKYALGIDLDVEDGTKLSPVYILNLNDKDIVYERPLNILLNNKSFGVYKITDEIAKVKKSDLNVIINNLEDKTEFSNDFIIEGIANNAKQVKIIVDGNEKEYKSVDLNKKMNESFKVSIKLDDFTPGDHTIIVKAYGRIPIYTSYSELYRVNFDIPVKNLAEISDEIGDDNGFNGNYSYPLDSTYSNQNDITKVSINQIGKMMRLNIGMKEITDGWNPSNGFDHLVFMIYFDDPNKIGQKVLPKQDGFMPENKDWDYMIYATGWMSSAHRSLNSSEDNRGEVITPTPDIVVDKQNNEITFLIPLSLFETDNVDNWNVYITTWDYDGIEAVLRNVDLNPEIWTYGGAEKGSPRIMDDILINLK
ncbi:alpha-amylase family glycosyl hydrolase [Oceanotoga sp. DSM 15011]|uniref:alpha-amylase family glycosyl hydrolase n=1 Tax=Oceanotoga sp. DSM 15011 TaxID=2984951 RepID=UPI0021F4D82B|nr:alpha-amylase family glycosyl hydrolase [Oceanotoga sp. DSM 15011]UYO99062.1 alpha-amylase family glycosyl hydrolase [Oceanotoga sp. DSM 15011]